MGDPKALANFAFIVALVSLGMSVGACTVAFANLNSLHHHAATACK